MSVMNKLCGLFTLTMITVMTAPTSAGDVRLGDLTISQPLTRASTNKARPGAAPNIPDKVSRKARHCFSKALYKERNHVERFFCSAPGSLDTSLSHAAGLIEIAACHA